MDKQVNETPQLELLGAALQSYAKYVDQDPAKVAVKHPLIVDLVAYAYLERWLDHVGYYIHGGLSFKTSQKYGYKVYEQLEDNMLGFRGQVCGSSLTTTKGKAIQLAIDLFNLNHDTPIVVDEVDTAPIGEEKFQICSEHPWKAKKQKVEEITDFKYLGIYIHPLHGDIGYKLMPMEGIEKDSFIVHAIDLSESGKDALRINVEHITAVTVAHNGLKPNGTPDDLNQSRIVGVSLERSLMNDQKGRIIPVPLSKLQSSIRYMQDYNFLCVYYKELSERHKVPAVDLVSIPHGIKKTFLINHLEQNVIDQMFLNPDLVHVVTVEHIAADHDLLSPKKIMSDPGKVLSVKFQI